jgi:hypothetical protein
MMTGLTTLLRSLMTRLRMFHRLLQQALLQLMWITTTHTRQHFLLHQVRHPGLQKLGTILRNIRLLQELCLRLNLMDTHILVLSRPRTRMPHKLGEAMRT